MDADEIGLNDVSRLMIGGAFAVHNAPGAGFLEKVYKNVLAHKLRKAGLAVEEQGSPAIIYDRIFAGEDAVDTIGERAQPVEIKPVNAHHAQRIDCLKASSGVCCSTPARNG